VVVNARPVREFARATGRLAKTDTIDAEILAHFAEAIEPEQRLMPDAQTRKLKALLSRRRQLLVMIVAEGDRSTHAIDVVRCGIAQIVKCLKKQLATVGRELEVPNTRSTSQEPSDALRHAVDTFMWLAFSPSPGSGGKRPNGHSPCQWPAYGHKRWWNRRT